MILMPKQIMSWDPKTGFLFQDISVRISLNSEIFSPNTGVTAHSRQDGITCLEINYSATYLLFFPISILDFR